MKDKKSHKEIHIIGAGFSGLTIAYYLNKYGFNNITIFEKNEKAGGLISTTKTEYGLVESAANTIILNQYLADLLKDIELSPQYPLKESRKRYIYNSGKFKKWPLSINDTLIFAKGLLKLAVNKKKYKPVKNQTIFNWALKVFNRNIANILITPGLQGIYASDGKELSSSLILNKFFSNQKDKKAKSQGVISFTAGMESLPNKLTKYLTSNGVLFNYNNRKNKINTNTLTIIATSLNDAKDLHSEILCKFEKVPLKDITTTTLFFNQNRHLVPGFGVLYPRDQDVVSLGSLMNDKIFSGRSIKSSSETWIIQNNKESDYDIVEQILKDRNTIIKRSEVPIKHFVKTWNGAFPLYGLELEQALSKEDKLSNEDIFLTGNYLGQLGLSGILAYNYKLAKSLRQTYD
jgi:oxygen-dependent protoporphyrinogen oxidase